ncbi:hypothetical protein CRG98_015615 [Punica granatum]|uniref:Uncharacterized protein n=1 Tax=Punica granatum TaxID=22663 RepID=A0A2I0K621_PUNGR|nr:hypothetical protein CRG98_015615 [Punica granatum]
MVSQNGVLTTSKGFLTTLTLLREEVVTTRGPIHRAQPPFHLFLLYRVCAPEFNLVGARMRAPKQTRLGSVHLPGDARRTHVRRSRHLPFYYPKVEGRQVTRQTKQAGTSPNPLSVPNGVAKLCAPEFNLVGARMRAPKQTRLGSVHLPGDARRTHVRRSRHLPFYYPKVEGRQVTRQTKQAGTSPNPLSVPNGVAKLCAPEFNLVGARMRAPKQTRLGSVHLPGDARRTHVRRSRHLPFYYPKVEGRQVTRQTKQAGTSPNPLSVPNGVAKLCAPEFNLVGARMRAPKQTRLGSVHLPGDARRTHVRRSRHLPFYYPKVEGRPSTFG